MNEAKEATAKKNIADQAKNEALKKADEAKLKAHVISVHAAEKSHAAA